MTPPGSGSLTTQAGARFAAIAAVSAALLALVASLTSDVDGVARADSTARSGLETRGYDVDFLLYSVKIVAALVAAAIVAAAVAGRRATAFSAGLLLAGCTVTAYGLREVLGWLGGDAASGLHETFPSVHSAVAIAAGIAFAILAPRRFRVAAALVGATYAAGVGIASVIAGGHYPSDVVGADMIAGVWIGLVGALSRSSARAAAETGTPPGARRDACILLASAGAGVAAALAISFAGFGSWASGEPWSVAAAAVLAGLPSCVFATLVGSGAGLAPSGARG